MKKYLNILFILWLPIFIYSQKVEVIGDIDLLGKIEMIKAVGDSSIFIGANAGLNDFGDRRNTFVGANSGMMNSGGDKNVFIGYNAGKFTNHGGNVFLGHESGMNNSNYNNIFIGNNTGKNNTGFENTMLGTQSGFFSDGSGHVFLGSFAGIYETGNNKLYIENSISSSPLIYGEFDNDLVRINGKLEVTSDAKIIGNTEIIKAVGDSSIFIGANAGLNYSGIENTFVGANTGRANSGGQGNTYIGYNAGMNNGSNGNTFIGRDAGKANNSYSNLFVGNLTGRDNTGFENTMIGTQAGRGSDGSGHVFLGSSAGISESGNNKLYIENSNSASPLIYGEFDNDLVRINGKLELTMAPTNPLDAATKAYVDSISSPTYVIGLSAEQGGYIFWVSLDGKHGLVAETVDQSSSSNWYNAQDIISNPSNHSADGDNFRDWRMPTKYELNEMYLQKAAIGAFSNGFYWSSTEFSIDETWGQDFTNGGQNDNNKDWNLIVRAVRAF